MGTFFPKIGGTEWSRPPSNKHQDGAQLTAGWMNSRGLRSKTVSFPAAFWTTCRMLSLAQSGRLVLRRQSGRAVEPYFSALETSKKHKSLKYLAPKTISGQVFGAGARTDFENPKVPPGGLTGKLNNFNRGGRAWRPLVQRDQHGSMGSDAKRGHWLTVQERCIS